MRSPFRSLLRETSLSNRLDRSAGFSSLGCQGGGPLTSGCFLGTECGDPGIRCAQAGARSTRDPHRDLPRYQPKRSSEGRRHRRKLEVSQTLEVASAKLPRFLDDVTLAIFTGNDALETGLVPAQDALALERVECSPYAQTFS